MMIDPVKRETSLLGDHKCLFLLLMSRRFLQAETGPWGHLSPSPRSPTRSSGTIVNSSITTMNNRISPAVTPSSAGPLRISPAASTTGFASSTTSRDQLMMQRRNRTSSMPAVPRHRVSLKVNCTVISHPSIFPCVLESSKLQLSSKSCETLDTPVRERVSLRGSTLSGLELQCHISFDMLLLRRSNLRFSNDKETKKKVKHFVYRIFTRFNNEKSRKKYF